MSELFLIRHAQATVNVDDLAFGNKEAPLTEAGIAQALNTRQHLIDQYGVVPEEYRAPVLASDYQRSYETACRIGFGDIHRNGIIDESDIYNEGALAGVDVIKKHVKEAGWVPEEEMERARLLIEGIRDGTLPYKIIFSHGMVIASVLTLLKQEGDSRVVFDRKRGFVPLQASVTVVNL